MQMTHVVLQAVLVTPDLQQQSTVFLDALRCTWTPACVGALCIDVASVCAPRGAVRPAGRKTDDGHFPLNDPEDVFLISARCCAWSDHRDGMKHRRLFANS